MILRCIFPIICLTFISGCGNSRHLISQDEAPFRLLQPTVETFEEQKTPGGPHVHKRIILLPVEEEDGAVLDTLYFEKRIIPLQRIQKDSYLVYKGEFIAEDFKPDVIMHGNASAEGGNRPPVIQGEFPFDLKQGEAVVRFTKNNEVYWVKIDQVTQVQEP